MNEEKRISVMVILAVIALGALVAGTSLSARDHDPSGVFWVSVACVVVIGLLALKGRDADS